MTNASHNYEQLGAILDDLREVSSKASNAWNSAVLYEGDPYETMSNAEWWIEIAFLKLLTATEVLGLSALQGLVLNDIALAKTDREGLGRSEDGVEEPYSWWMARFRQYLKAIETLGGRFQERTITKDVVEIIRAAAYPMSDPALFGKPPSNEDDVHRRIEGILRCVFPDLKHKPSISKPIKNFQPDTGLPSVRTLIEYKYIARAEDVAVIVDQILADTRGYASPEWDSFIYVLYETGRYRPEYQWNQLLRDSGVADNTLAIVLSGEPAVAERKDMKRRRSAVNRDQTNVSEGT
jgi:hypothetical protein